jgi:hypothetical protein
MQESGAPCCQRIGWSMFSNASHNIEMGDHQRTTQDHNLARIPHVSKMCKDKRNNLNYDYKKVSYRYWFATIHCMIWWLKSAINIIFEKNSIQNPMRLSNHSRDVLQ